MRRLVPLLFLFLSESAWAATAMEADVTYLKNTKNKFYAEVPSSAVSVHCSKPDGDDPNTAVFTSLKLDLEESVHDFLFRRPWALSSCRDRQRAMRKILAKARRVRIYGVHGLDMSGPGETDVDGVMPPSRMGKLAKVWIFEFLDGGKNGCHGYFSETCGDIDAVMANLRD